MPAVPPLKQLYQRQQQISEELLQTTLLTWFTSVSNFRPRQKILTFKLNLFIGVGMFVCTFIYMSVWVYTGEVGSKRLRESYLRAVLRQDIAYFDNVGAGEVATRIQTDTRKFVFFEYFRILLTLE